MKDFIEGVFGKKIFELAIILIGILLVAYIFGFWGKGSKGSFSIKNSSTCGISVTSPEKNARVTSSDILIKGSMNGCGWGSLSGVVGTVEVLDSSRMLLTDGKITLYSDTADLRKITFSQTIRLSSSPNTASGEIIVTSASGDDGVKVIRIPVRFSRNSSTAPSKENTSTEPLDTVNLEGYDTEEVEYLQ